MTDARASGDDTGGYVLDQLGFMEEFVRETKETNGVTGEAEGGEEGVGEKSSDVGSKKREEAGDISEMDMGGPNRLTSNAVYLMQLLMFGRCLFSTCSHRAHKSISAHFKSAFHCSALHFL